MNATNEQLQRQQAVSQAIANIAARGVTVKVEVRQLYQRYLDGELSRKQISAMMGARASAIKAASRLQICSYADHLRIT